MLSKISSAKLGEEISSSYLLKQGYKILERNYRKPWGEIDIIAQKKKDLVFIEVKTLIKPDFLGEESINNLKKKKLIKLAKLYLLEKKYPSEQSWQIDVIAIEVLENKKYRLRHTKKAVRE